jgi:hypothetical protein
VELNQVAVTHQDHRRSIVTSPEYHFSWKYRPFYFVLAFLYAQVGVTSVRQRAYKKSCFYYIMLLAPGMRGRDDIRPGADYRDKQSSSIRKNNAPL